ncbi:F-box protein [Sporobolomyces koalae]|uniref:F-box protein n=1 Tax=Sporobolomyces koalae TaxID=500713 RepID=UPI00317E142D
MHINDLPNEILADILRLRSHDNAHRQTDRYLRRDLSDLHAAALVSKRWNNQATPLLYLAARLTDIRAAAAYTCTLASKPHLGSRLRYLRIAGPHSSRILDLIAPSTPNVEGLWISSTSSCEISPIFAFSKLSSLVIYGIKLAFDRAACTHSLSLPMLRHLSFCGVKNSTLIEDLFTPTGLPQLKAIAISWSQHESEECLSALPSETIVISSSELRRSRGQAIANTTLYTDRFYSLAEGYNDFGKRAPFPSHIQLPDIDNLGPVLPLLELYLKEPLIKQYLETVWLPRACLDSTSATREAVRAWSDQHKIKIFFFDEAEFTTESIIPHEFVEFLQHQRKVETRTDPRS